MGIAPVQNLLPMQVKLPAAETPQTERARAVEFRGQEQDATYTPGGGAEDDADRDGSSPEGSSQDERQADAQIVEVQADSVPDETPSAAVPGPTDEPPAESTISVFA
jgi:hypothetical protein